MALKTVFYGVDPSVPAIVLEGATRPFYLTQEIKAELCQHFGYDINQGIILFDQHGSILTQDHLFQCDMEYYVGQLQATIYDCPPKEITTSWKLKPKVSLQGSVIPQVIRFDVGFWAKVKLLSSEGEDILDAFMDENGQMTSEIIRPFNAQGISSFAFKILVSSLTKNKTKKKGTGQSATNPNNSEYSTTSASTSTSTSTSSSSASTSSVSGVSKHKCIPTQFYLQFNTFTTDASGAVSLIQIVSDAISVFPHSKYIQAAPKIDKIIPDHGPANTETEVAIHGQRFLGPTIVYFGGFPSPQPALLRGDQALECPTPKCPAGEVTVKVYVCGRASEDNKSFRFIEQPNSVNNNGFIFVQMPSGGFAIPQGNWPLLFNCLTGVQSAPSQMQWTSTQVNTLQNGKAYLHFTAAFGHIELTRSLLMCGADANIMATEGYAPLWWAVANDHVDVVNLLLAYGANPNTPALPDELYPIHMATLHENEDIFFALTDAGADIHATDKHGNTTLHYACWCKNKKIIDYLLRQNPAVNAQNQRKETPLHWAVSNNEFSLIRKLICSGASLTITNEDGLTAQDLCGESRPEFEMAINLSPRERDPKKKALPPTLPLASLQRLSLSLISLSRVNTQHTEYWTAWLDRISSANSRIIYSISARADLSEVTFGISTDWSHPFIQHLIDFFWKTGTSEPEIDRLSDIGALINPERMGSWIKLSCEERDGGWEFPVDMPLKFGLESCDSVPEGDSPALKIEKWAVQHRLSRCYSVRRDLVGLPPHSTQIRMELSPPATEAAADTELKLALSALKHFQFQDIPDEHVKALESFGEESSGISLSVVTCKATIIKIGVLIPTPSKELVKQLVRLLYQSPARENPPPEEHTVETKVQKLFELLDQSQAPKYVEYECHKPAEHKSGPTQRDYDVTLHYDFVVAAT